MSNETGFACKDLTVGQLNALVKKLGGEDVVRGILGGAIEVVTNMISFIVATFTVIVDRTKSVDELVKDGGFGRVHDCITSRNIPSPEDVTKQEEELVLFCFDGDMSSDAIRAEMDKEGCEPADIWDLIAFAKMKPRFKVRFVIIALESIWLGRGGIALPALEGDNSLTLRIKSHPWNTLFQFLARRRKKSA